jgi:iron(III) transport system substrate-binding protein
MVCTRSSSNVYMLSLLASIVAREGEEAAKDWAAGVWSNRARDPAGGDTDQLKAIVSGECDIVLSNHYYFVRALRGEVPGLSEEIDKIAWVFPNQETTGAHVNISGAGIAKHAPNAENAKAFIEYLVSPEAQEYFALGNNEFPVVEGVEAVAEAAGLGPFEADEQPLDAFSRLSGDAQRIYDEVGYR